MDAQILTNDFNLNKVCELHRVQVLNINDLANAVKPVVIPGEDMQVVVIKDGKEHNQGVAYLDDGTMIVVEGGRSYIGQAITVTVTSVLQTSAGRMIFAKPKEGQEVKYFALRGRVLGMNPTANGKTVIEAEIPMLSLYGYCTDLRSMTGGRGDFEYECVRYEQTPSDIQDAQVKERAEKVAENNIE